MRRIVALSALCAAVLTAVVWIGPPAGAVIPFDEAQVRLYSGGEVVGEWVAVGPGRVQDGALTFPVRRGTREVEVRIRGTWAFEQKP